MLRNVVSVFTFFVAMLMTGVAFADVSPTLHQIYEAAQAGRLKDAQGMINQVLKEHPNSAKAHYVDAEILAKTGNINQAREEFGNAERLEPGFPFASPQAVQNLKTLLTTTQAGLAPMSNRPAQQGFPWGWLILGIAAIVIITLIMRAFSRRNYASAGYPGNFQPGSGAGGYAPMAPMSPGMGSGIMSGLATGAALGAGLVAGEELAHHFLDGNGNAVPQAQAMNTAWDTQSDNMGGNDFGVADNSSWDDNSGIADISGGNDWT